MGTLLPYASAGLSLALKYLVFGPKRSTVGLLESQRPLVDIVPTKIVNKK